MRAGRHVRQRIYPESPPLRGSHTGSMSRESHATPGFRKRRPADVEAELGALQTINLPPFFEPPCCGPSSPTQAVEGTGTVLAEWTFGSDADDDHANGWTFSGGGVGGGWQAAGGNPGGRMANGNLATGPFQTVAEADCPTVDPDTAYFFSVDVLRASSTCSLTIAWLNSSGGTISTDSSIATGDPAGDWVTMTAERTSPSNAARVRLVISGGGGSSNNMSIDNMRILFDVTPAVVGSTPVTLGGPGDHLWGSEGSYLPTGSVIEHNDLSGEGGEMHDASQVTYDNASSGLTADDVQAAIDELDAAIGAIPSVSDHLSDTSDAHDASAVSVLDTAGDFTADNVEDALAELLAAISSGGIPATIFDAAGDLIVASAADTASRLAAGSEDEVLTIVSGVPAWAAASGGGGGASYGQVYEYPSSFSGDSEDLTATTNWADVAAFDVKQILNGTVLHLRTIGPSKDHIVRKTLSSTKAGAFDFRFTFLATGGRWTADRDTYFEITLRTSAGTVVAIARMSFLNADGGNLGNNYQDLRVGTTAVVTSNNLVMGPPGLPSTLRISRDGSNVLTFEHGWGTAPLALETLLQFADNLPYGPTSSGTIERVELRLHTPAGPGASQHRVDAYLETFQSL